MVQNILKCLLDYEIYFQEAVNQSFLSNLPWSVDEENNQGVCLAKPIKMCVGEFIVNPVDYILLGPRELIVLTVNYSKQLSLYLLDIEAKNLNPNTQYIRYKGVKYF